EHANAAEAAGRSPGDRLRHLVSRQRRGVVRHRGDVYGGRRPVGVAGDQALQTSATAPAASARNTGVPAPPRSRIAARSSSGTLSAAVTTAAASSPSAPLETAIATASRNADSCSDGK